MSAPHFEQTPIGEQAVIPGCEARSFPRRALTSKRRQVEAGGLFAPPAVVQADVAEIAAEEHNAQGPIVCATPTPAEVLAAIGTDNPWVKLVPTSEIGCTYPAPIPAPDARATRACARCSKSIAYNQPGRRCELCGAGPFHLHCSHLHTCPNLEGDTK